METRYFLFSLIAVPRYWLDWGYTIPQIELMCLDVPIISYSDNKKPSKQRYEEVRKRWESKYREDTKVDLTQILEGFDRG